MGVTIDDLLLRLNKAKRCKIHGQPGCNAVCPAHEDKSPSFYAWEGEDGWLHLRCRSGCTEDAILASLGMSQDDRKLTNESDEKPMRETAYTYKDSSGAAVMRKLRIERHGQKKTFKLEAYLKGAWQPNLQGLNGQRHTLYNLPAVRKAIADGSTVYVNEGEKACDYMASKGLVGTCQAFGADASPEKKWLSVHTDQLRGAVVVIVADRDEVGEGYAKHVAAQLSGVAKSVRVVQSKTEGAKDDAYDHLAKGYTESDWSERRDLLPPRGLQTTRIDKATFQPSSIEYLVKPYLPKGKCVLLDADGGTGKTSLALAWAGALTSGYEPVTGNRREPCRILYLHKGEDDSAELATVFQANNGDFDNIEFYDGDLTFDHAGLKQVSEAINDGKFRLVVVDALFYFLLGMMDDTYNALPALGVMQRLNHLASATQCTFWNIRHTKKGQVGQKASDLGMGSVQFRNSHRGQILLRYHPTNKGLVVATDEKGSLLVPRGEHFCYRRVGLEIQYVHGVEDPFSPDADQPKVSKLDQAKAFLVEHCTGQFVKVEWLKQLATERKLGWRTVEEAKSILGVEHTKADGFTSSWIIRQSQEDPYA